MGLQHHPKFPDRSAVNWDGYTAKGEYLDSDEPTLPSAIEERATRDFSWVKNVPYRLTVGRGEQISADRFHWVGSVENLRTGERVEVRRLIADSSYLRGPVMYIESYGPCDGPRFEARWSNATAVSGGGGVRIVNSMRVDYQPHAAGGCTNTNSRVEGDEFVQRAGQMRVTKAGSTIRLD